MLGPLRYGEIPTLDIDSVSATRLRRPGLLLSVLTQPKVVLERDREAPDEDHYGTSHRPAGLLGVLEIGILPKRWHSVRLQDPSSSRYQIGREYGRSHGEKQTAPREEEPSVSGGGQFRVGSELLSGLMATATRGPIAIQYTEVDGKPLVEGDIVPDLLPSERLSEALGGDGARRCHHPRRSVPVGQWGFPDEIDAGLPDQARVTNAIAHWERNTRIRFVRRTAANPGTVPGLRALRIRWWVQLARREAGWTAKHHTCRWMRFREQ